MIISAKFDFCNVNKLKQWRMIDIVEVGGSRLNNGGGVAEL